MMSGGEGDPARRAGLSIQHPLRPFFEREIVCPLAVFRQLLVTNQPVRPEVGDMDFEFVFAGLGGAGDLGAEGRLSSSATTCAAWRKPAGTGILSPVRRRELEWPAQALTE
jgi:hypothetical protein